MLAVGGSTLALLQASDAGATAPAGWVIVFFAAAQIAALATALAALQAAALRKQHATAQEVALLCRRNAWGLLAAGITLFAAGGAVPGRGSAVLLLAGPLLAVVAGLSVARSRSTVRGLPTVRHQLVRSPCADLNTLIRTQLPDLPSSRLLAPTVIAASAGAFVWDQADHGSFTSALTSAVVEAVLVVLGFLLLAAPLGLRARRRRQV